MEPKMIHVLIVGSVLGGLAHTAWAADQEGSSRQQGMTPASQSQLQATPGSTQAASTQPIASETVRGSIAALNLAATQPSMKLSATNGKSWTFELDPKSTSVWKEGQSTHLNQLKTGQSVEVRHAVISGKDIAQSIRVVSTKPIASSTAKPHRSY